MVCPRLDTDAESDGSDDLLQTMPERPRSDYLLATTGRNVLEVLEEDHQVKSSTVGVFSEFCTNGFGRNCLLCGTNQQLIVSDCTRA
jgi:hypothetical protein